MADSNSKLLSSGKFSSVPNGGASSKGTSGPTSSSRSYPKAAVGSTPSLNAGKFNPMSHPPSTFGVKGV